MSDRAAVFPWGQEPEDDWQQSLTPPGDGHGKIPKLDGRLARSQRTRAAVIEALIGLLEEGEFKPPAKVIAERSGVSTRSIFQHFPDLETLFTAAVAHGVNQFAPLVQPISDHLALPARINALARQRVELFEKAGNVYWAGQIAAPLSDTLRDTFRRVEYILRVQIEVALKPELIRLRKPKRMAIVARLAAVVGFHGWYGLRRVQGLTPGETRAAMVSFIASQLPE